MYSVSWINFSYYDYPYYPRVAENLGLQHKIGNHSHEFESANTIILME